MIATILSQNNIPIRLTRERWQHIVEEHSELADLQAEILSTLAKPERILAGNAGELLAASEINKDKWLVVVYKETNGGGFVITAFFTKRRHSLDRRKQVWPQPE
ncbi:MAG: hypothetical protein R6X34_20790 [Chloroflexota bacterium]|jgi:hypothetical protein